MQLSLQYDLLHSHENNRESKSILEANRERLSAQCAKVLELFRQGKKLTVRSAMIEHSIGHLPRRVKDLKEAGYQIKSTLIDKHYKEYFL